jgi:hypothetical protein
MRTWRGGPGVTEGGRVVDVPYILQNEPNDEDSDHVGRFGAVVLSNLFVGECYSTGNMIL